MAAFDHLGFYPADILLPKEADMTKWACVACDQFTSQPEYWQKAAAVAGDAPSALNLILPEAHLGDPDVESQIGKINEKMDAYLQNGVFREYPDSLFYIERTQSDGKIRHGLVGMVDLEDYDYTPGSGALIRATEGTILSRIPPRVKVREHAPIELPHIMILIDDPDRTVIEPFAGGEGMEPVYDFDLMLGGGHLKGWRLNEAQMEQTAGALRRLGTEEEIERKYGLKGVKLCVERVDILRRDLGPKAVDRRLLLGLCLHVNAAHALFDLDKVAGGTIGAHARLNLPTRKASDKAQRRGLVPQVGEHNGDVDSLAAGQDLLIVHAVNLAQAKVVETNDVVERRVERYGVDHELLPTSTTLSAS